MRATRAKQVSPHSRHSLHEREAGSAALPDWAGIRRQFPILARTVHGKPLVYLDNAATTQKPRAVLDRVLAFYAEENSNVHRGVHYLSERASECYEAARETVRRFFHAGDAGEVIFTHGATDSINMLAYMIGQKGLGAGDEILVTQMEHHSNLLPWQMLCQRSGATLQIVPFRNDGSLEVEALDSLLTGRTRLFALTHVSNVLGTINPVREIIRMAHTRGVPVLVDAAQSVPHLAVDVQDLDCDFLAFSGHKLFAETGIGVLYGKRKWLEEMTPCIQGGGMIQSVNLHSATFADLPYRFEAGTPNIAGAVSLAAAIEFLESIGMQAVTEHEAELMRHATEAISEMDGVQIYGRTADKCGALSFNLDGLDAYDVATLLDQYGIAVRSGTHCAEPVVKHYGVHAAVRASFALYNTIEDIDRLIEGLAQVRRMLA